MMEPHMIENYILIVFMIVVNHVGFMFSNLNFIRLIQFSFFLSYRFIRSRPFWVDIPLRKLM